MFSHMIKRFDQSTWPVYDICLVKVNLPNDPRNLIRLIARSVVLFIYFVYLFITEQMCLP